MLITVNYICICNNPRGKRVCNISINQYYNKIMSNGLKNNQYYKICVDAYHLVMVIYSYRLVKKRGDNLNVKKLKGKRVEKDFTQLSISKALGMNVLSYHRKEKGIREFSMEEIEKLSKILELSLIQANEIFFNNDLPNG